MTRAVLCHRVIHLACDSDLSPQHHRLATIEEHPPLQVIMNRPGQHDVLDVAAHRAVAGFGGKFGGVNKAI